ncbi:MAG: AMP-binding protein [Sphingomonas sp.]
MDQLGLIATINAIRSPGRLAVKMLGSGEGRTWAQLEDRSTRLANALIGSGLKSGDRIAAWLEDSLEYVETYFAAAKAGLVMVPVNERFRAAEAGYQIERTEASALLFSSGVVPALTQLLGEHEIPIVIGVSGAARDVRGALDFEALLAKGSANPLPLPDENAPFSICFTSGTTGFPKGATLTHRSLHNVARTQTAGLRLVLGSINLQLASMSFPATFGSHILSHAYVGGTTVLVGRWGGDAEALMSVVESEGINHFYLPTPLLAPFTELCAADRTRWRMLQSVLHAGSRADPDLLRDLADVIGRRFVEGWGMSEISGGICTAISVRDLVGGSEASDLFASVGRPVPDAAIRLVDENRAPVPHDGETVGELVVKASSLMRGYWGDQAATDKAIVDGWYHSGDLGRIDPAGYVYIVDRRPDLIISGGMNVYPAELELVINKIDGVQESAVVAGAHSRWGQTPVACIVRRPGSALTEEQVIAVFAEQMASYKKPTRVIFLDELPRHPTSAKLLRTVLRDMVAESAREVVQ